MIPNFKDSIIQAQELIKEDLQQVNTQIIELMQSDVEVIPQIAQHLILAGGKRIRPMLTILSALMFGYQGSKHLLLSACVEFIHTATLLHDDVVDENDNRRGFKTPNSIWGNKSAVLVGDFLFSKSFELMVKTENLSILETLSNASSIIAEGEVLQLSAIHNTNLTLEQYIKIIESKTSALFSAATSVGAMIAGADPRSVEAIYNYAHFLGTAFQIIDDILDYTGEQDITGKNIGTDLYEGKITLPIILCLQECTQEEKYILLRIFKDFDIQENDLANVLKMLNKYNSINKSMYYANDYIEKSIFALDNIDLDNKYKVALKNIALSSLNRKF